MKYLLKYEIFESQYLKYFKVGMEFHNTEGKVVGKITKINKPNFCIDCGCKIKNIEDKFCVDCGKKITHINYSNLVNGEDYIFNVKELYDKLKKAGWDNDKDQTIDNPKDLKKNDNPTNLNTNSNNKLNGEFDKLCDEYSKMKGANLDHLNQVKKMAKSEKEDSIKLAMIRRLINNLKD